MSSQIITDARIIAGMKPQMAARDAALRAGGERLGWKAGFGAPAAQAKFKLSGPLTGYMLQSALVENGGTVSLTGWKKPIAEPEICVRMGTDLPAGATEAQVRAAIASLAPTFELVDLAFPPEDVEKVLASNIFHRHVVVGPSDTSRAGAKLDGLAASITRAGTEIAATKDLEAITGRVVDTVRRVADVAAQFADGLKAGDIIITGSVVTPIPIEPGDKEMTFRLSPIGEVSVRFG